MSRELFVYYFLLICVSVSSAAALGPFHSLGQKTKNNLSVQVELLYTCPWHRSSRASSSSSGGGQAQTLPSG